MKNALNCAEADEWLDAIESEIVSLIKNDTWSITKTDNFDDVVGCRFVLTNKCNENGEIERREARLVAKGYSQTKGVNYNETFAPVARLETLRLVLALSVHYGYSIWQIDVVTAYLNGNLNERVKMKVPDMLQNMLERILIKHNKQSTIGKRALEMLNKLNDGGNLCILRKALYGLRQSGRQWYEKLNTELSKLGLKCTINEPCLFIGNFNGNKVMLMVYVDDILICTTERSVAQDIKCKLAKSFEIKDLDMAKYCLGLEISQNNAEIHLCQKGYVNYLLKQYGMENCNPVSTPSELNLNLNDVLAKPYNERKYHELIGSLMYLAVATRPDIANVVSKLAQYVSKPLDTHWNAAKRILRYLAGTRNLGLKYRRNSSSLNAYADADYRLCVHIKLCCNQLEVTEAAYCGTFFNRG